MENIKITTRKNKTKRVAWYNTEPKLTDESFLDESDINSIMRRYLSTQVLPLHGKKGVYADITDFPDFIEMDNQLKEAQAAFNQLPASIRDRFFNQPQNLINFLSDEKNKAEAISLGLIKGEEKNQQTQTTNQTTNTSVDKKTEPEPKS